VPLVEKEEVGGEWDVVKSLSETQTLTYKKKKGARERNTGVLGGSSFLVLRQVGGDREIRGGITGTWQGARYGQYLSTTKKLRKRQKNVKERYDSQEVPRSKHHKLGNGLEW